MLPLLRVNHFLREPPEFPPAAASVPGLASGAATEPCHAAGSAATDGAAEPSATTGTVLVCE